MIALLVAHPVGAATCLDGSHCVYIPSVANGAPGDLILSGVEVIQAVQDTQNSVPLVAGRRTVMRIYARTGESALPLSNVEILVTANTGGVALSSSPAVMTSTLPLVNNRADLNTTINYDLPATWLNGTVDLAVRLDPNNKIIETNETNNTYLLRLTFNPVPPLQVKIVPIQYTHTDGVVYPAPKIDTISDWVYRTYPVAQVETSWHAAYPFTGNLTTADSWYSLLNQITSLKSAEGAPASQVYYALVPVTNGTSTWFSGGTAGIAWIGLRTSAGLNTTGSAGQVAAHEIGHNLGMLHSPCGTPTSLDPDYPYPDGSIGQYGLDVFSRTLYSPSSRDVMSYCTPKWISDYTYSGLYQAQAQVEASLQPAQVLSEDTLQRSLLVRYQFDPGGVQTLPAYVLSGPPQAQPEAGEYTVQVLGARDELLSETRVRAYSMGLDGAEGSAIHAIIPLDDRPAARLLLLKDGQVLAEQAFQVQAPQEAGKVDAEAGGGTARVRWADGDLPVLVRYTTDGGQTWTILGVDVTGGEIPIPTAALANQDTRFEVIPAGAWK